MEAIDKRLFTQLNLDQRNTLEALLETKSIEQAIDAYFDAYGLDNTSHYGGHFDVTEKKSKSLKQNVMETFVKFVCDEEYLKDKKKEKNLNVFALESFSVSYLSSILSPIIGCSAYFLAPVIVLLIVSMLRISKDAYCATYYSQSNQQLGKDDNVSTPS